MSELSLHKPTAELFNYSSLFLCGIRAINSTTSASRGDLARFFPLTLRTQKGCTTTCPATGNCPATEVWVLVVVRPVLGSDPKKTASCELKARKCSMVSEPADSLDERAESVTNTVLAALLAELTTLSKDRPPHIAEGRAAPPPTAELIAASKERERTGIGGGLPQAQPSALQHPCSTLPELLADMAECGSRVAASTEQCRASTSAMRAEMVSFATAMQISPVDTPPRREESPSSGVQISQKTRQTDSESPPSSGARIVIRARGHGAIGFVRLPLAADHRPADATGPTPGERDRRAGPACHDRRAELIGGCSPGGKPAGATFAVVRAAISAQLGEDLSAVAPALPAGACNSKVDRWDPPTLPHSGLDTSSW